VSESTCSAYGSRCATPFRHSTAFLIWSVSPGAPTTRFTTFTPASVRESNTTMSPSRGERIAGRRVWISGSSAP